MSQKHKGSGYNVAEVISMAANTCTAKCGCSIEKFMLCANRHCGKRVDPKRAAEALKSADDGHCCPTLAPARAFADWFLTREFAEVSTYMKCDMFGMHPPHENLAAMAAAA